MSPAQDPQATINQFWSERADGYDAQPGHSLHSANEREAWLAALRELLPPAPAVVLDVGTGTGFLAHLIADLGHHTIGIDLAEGMLAIAREKAAGRPNPPEFRIGDANQPPLLAGSVDVVISRHVVWTLRDPVRAFGLWRDLLRSGGRVIIIDGLWFADGTPFSARDHQPNDEEQAFRAHYTDEIKAALPFMSAQTLDPIFEAVRQAGLIRPRVTRLDDVEWIERQQRTEGPTPPPRFVITASRGR